MKTKARIVMIGNYLDDIEAYLRRNYGIFCNELINCCNPLAMVGKKDDMLADKFKNINSMPTQLNLRKNLSQMLSRDANNYCSNHNITPLGRNCEYSNTADYIVLCNTSMAYALYSNGDILYSDIWPQNDFTNNIKNNKSFKKIPFPFNGIFNWKYYYDLFIKEICSVYDSDHIILVKTNVSPWHYNDKKIALLEKKSLTLRNQIQEIDDYFIEKTCCIVINEPYNHIPTKLGSGALVYAVQSRFCNECTAQKIAEIILDKKFDKNNNITFSSNDFANFLQIKLSDKIISNQKESIDYIIEKGISFQQFDHACKDVVLLDRIKTLKDFFNPDKNYTLSDYISNLPCEDACNYELIYDYVELLKLDINDLMAINYIYKNFEKKPALSQIINCVLKNNSALPIISAMKLRSKNEKFLKDYKYLSTNLRDLTFPDRVIIKIDEKILLSINPKSDLMIDIINLDECDYSALDVIDNGYTCNLQQAYMLCSNLSFYIERARRNESNHPVKIIFNSVEDFAESLYYMDYSDLLSNERFLIGLDGDEFDLNGYKTVCDLSFLFKKETKICVLRSGFTDQLCYYIFAQRLKEQSESEIYYDDLIYYNQTNFNGEEIYKIAKEDISERMLSNILTPKLLNNYRQCLLAPDKLVENGLVNLAVIGTEENRLSEIKKGNKVYIYSSSYELLDNVMNYDSNIFLKYYYCMIRPEWLMQLKQFELNEYIKFPEMSGKNKIIEGKMLDCDAVVIHVRRGDFVNWGWESDNEFYIESIQMLLDIPDYKRKKYFVFSDDIPWVKAHADEMGLNMVGDDEVIYVDHNKNETSYLDMYLISLGKVIIGSGSGFVRMAALYSKRCEDFICYNQSVMDTFNNYVRKNVHEFDGFSKRYGINYSKKAVRLPASNKHNLDNMNTQSTALSSGNSQPAPESKNNAGGGNNR